MLHTLITGDFAINLGAIIVMSSNKNGVTLVLRDLETSELRVNIDIGGKVKGYFFADAIVRSKEEMKDLAEKIQNDTFKDDSEFLRACFTGFTGLGTEDGPLEGEAAWNYVLNGKLSGYLVSALSQSYFTQYGEALQKNLQRWRGR